MRDIENHVDIIHIPPVQQGVDFFHFHLLSQLVVVPHHIHMSHIPIQLQAYSTSSSLLLNQRVKLEQLIPTSQI